MTTYSSSLPNSKKPITADENLVILLTLTVPVDKTKMSVNLKAPIVINADNREGAQVVAENPDYEIKYMIYDILKAAKERRSAGC